MPINASVQFVQFIMIKKSFLYYHGFRSIKIVIRVLVPTVTGIRIQNQRIRLTTDPGERVRLNSVHGIQILGEDLINDITQDLGILLPTDPDSGDLINDRTQDPDPVEGDPIDN